MFDIAIVGHISKDELILNGEKTISCGGVPYYSGIAAHQLGNSVAVVTKLSEQDIELLNPLKSKVKFYTSFSKSTTAMRNKYPDPNNLDYRISTLQAIGEPFKIEDIPELFPKVYHLGALLKGEIPYNVFTKLKERNSKLAIDVQGFIRVAQVGQSLHYEYPADNLEEFLNGIDFLKVDRKEAEFLTGEKDLHKAVKTLGLYVSEVILTHNNGVIVYESKFDKIHKAKFSVEKIKGRTGRGDTCIVTYITYRAVKEYSAQEACNYAAALTSRKLGHPGPLESDDLCNLEEIIEKVRE